MQRCQLGQLALAAMVVVLASCSSDRAGVGAPGDADSSSAMDTGSVGAVTDEVEEDPGGAGADTSGVDEDPSGVDADTSGVDEVASGVDADRSGAAEDASGVDADTSAEDTDNGADAADSSQCADADGDGYGEGPGCAGPDCDDGDDLCWSEEDPCCIPPLFEGKKGIAKIAWNAENEEQIVTLDVYWNYNWTLEPSEFQPSGIEYVPMIWGVGKDKTLKGMKEHLKWAFGKALDSQIANGSVDLLLGFNEPDKADQANLSVEDAVALWPLLEATGLPLASPATAGDDWLHEFMAEAELLGLQIDYIAYHWYGRPEWWRIMNKLKGIHQMYGLPIIVTEFAPAWWGPHDYTADQACYFAKKVLPWLEEQEWIAGYAWFPFNEDNQAGGMSALFTNDGDLTPLGAFYKSVTADNPEGDQSIVCE